MKSRRCLTILIPSHPQDEKGQPYVLQAVKKAEALVVAETGYNHEYIPIEGWAPFRVSLRVV